MLTSSDAHWVECFARSLIDCTYFISKLASSDVHRVGYFNHSQGVCALFRFSFYLMLTMSCMLPALQLVRAYFNAPFIRCWPSRMPCSFAGRTCFASNLASFDTDHVSHVARPQTVRILFQCLSHLIPTESDALLFHSWCVLRFHTLFRSRWPHWTLCFPAGRMCFVSIIPSSDADRIWVLCSFTACTRFVSVLPSIWCWPGRMLHPIAGCKCFILNFASFDADHVSCVTRL
jgi:hypothetical protein